MDRSDAPRTPGEPATPEDRRASVVPGAVVLVVVAASVGALAWWDRAGWPNGRAAGVASALTALSWVLPGALIAHHRPRLVFGWLLLGGGFVLAVGNVASAYGAFGTTGSEHLPAATWAAWLGSWFFFPHLAAMEAVYLLFPTGSLPSPRWRPALVFALGVNAAMVVVAALQPTMLDQTHWQSPVSNPIGVHAASALFPMMVVGEIVALVCGLAAVVARLRGNVSERALLRLVFALGVLNAAEGALLVDPPGPWVYALAVPSTILLTGAIAVGVLRYRLWDLRGAVSRTITLVVLTALVAGLFAGSVALVALVADGGRPAGILIAAALAAVAAVPAQRRIANAVDRLLYGQRREPYAVLSALGAELERAGDPEDGLRHLVDTVRRALRVPWAAIQLDMGEAPSHLFGVDEVPADPAVRVPLRHGDRDLGALIVALRPGDIAFGAADRRLLDDLARQAGSAANATYLSAALHRARERLVAAREEERRRIRRDLHDGVASALTAIGLKLDSAMAALPPDTTTSRALLGRLRGDVGATLDDVRRLVTDLRPPALEDLGFAGAMSQLAERYDRPGLAVRLHGAVPDGELPAAVEVAAYRIAAEALQNAARHASASSCTLRVALVSGELVVEVRDNGVGLTGSTPARNGVGTKSMTERAEELGGTLTMNLEAHGTLVAAHIPLRAP